MVQVGNGSCTATHAYYYYFFFEKCVSSNCDNKSSTNFSCSKLTVEMLEEHVKLAQN